MKAIENLNWCWLHRKTLPCPNCKRIHEQQQAALKRNLHDATKALENEG